MKDNRDHLRALLATYNEVTGFDLAMTPQRDRVLRSVDKLKLTPDDVRRVMKELKRLVSADPKHYPEACLDFNNAVANVERLEERAKRLRKKIAKKKAAETTPQPAAQPTPAEGGSDIAERLRQFRLSQTGGQG